MAGEDKRIEVLEEELKLLKGEVKRTLVDLRAFIMREDSPLNERLDMAGTGTTERIITKEVIKEDSGKIEALEDQIKLLMARELATPIPAPAPVAPPYQQPPVAPPAEPPQAAPEYIQPPPAAPQVQPVPVGPGVTQPYQEQPRYLSQVPEAPPDYGQVPEAPPDYGQVSGLEPEPSGPVGPHRPPSNVPGYVHTVGVPVYTYSDGPDYILPEQQPPRPHRRPAPEADTNEREVFDL